MWETLSTVTLCHTSTYCVPWLFQLPGRKKRRVDGSLDDSSFEPFEIMLFLFPLLVLNVRQHVVQLFGQRKPSHRLAASLL